MSYLTSSLLLLTVSYSAGHSFEMETPNSVDVILVSDTAVIYCQWRSGKLSCNGTSLKFYARSHLEPICNLSNSFEMRRFSMFANMFFWLSLGTWHTFKDILTYLFFKKKIQRIGFPDVWTEMQSQRVNLLQDESFQEGLNCLWHALRFQEQYSQCFDFPPQSNLLVSSV